MNEYRVNNCPLCKSGKINFLGELPYGKKVMFSTNEVSLSRIPELWNCKSCLSSFVQNIVDADTAKKLYEDGQAGDRWSTLAFDQNKTREVLEQLEKIFKLSKNILDVGCNTGELLDYAKKYGCKTSGIEFSHASRNVLLEKGHSSYSTLDQATELYDVITAFDLIEHLYDIPAFLNNCHDRLSKGGRLVILTGNINSFSATLATTNWWYAQYPEHIVFPSKKFFKDFSEFSIEKYILTYASVGYKKPLLKSFLHAFKMMLRRQTYVGLPSLGPDHFMLILQK